MCNRVLLNFQTPGLGGPISMRNNQYLSRRLSTYRVSKVFNILMQITSGVFASIPFSPLPVVFPFTNKSCEFKKAYIGNY